MYESVNGVPHPLSFMGHSPELVHIADVSDVADGTTITLRLDGSPIRIPDASFVSSGIDDIGDVYLYQPKHCVVFRPVSEHHYEHIRSPELRKRIEILMSITQAECGGLVGMGKLHAMGTPEPNLDQCIRNIFNMAKASMRGEK